MMKKFLGAAASVAVLVTGAQAYAATLVIDSFGDQQRVQDTPTNNPNNSQVSAAVLGGFRDLEVLNTNADGSAEGATELHVTGGNLKFSNVAGAQGEGYLTYDGDDDATSVNTTGLGGANLLIGANPYLFFAEPADVKFDNTAFFTVTAWDMDGGIATYEETLTATYDPRLFFSDFTTTAGFDFGNLGALQFFISSTGLADSVDGAITQIEVRADDVAPIPLPASGLLLLGGMGGLTFLRRRQKA
jgi:hypothetical protein